MRDGLPGSIHFKLKHTRVGSIAGSIFGNYFPIVDDAGGYRNTVYKVVGNSRFVGWRGSAGAGQQVFDIHLIAICIGRAVPGKGDGN